MILFVFFVGIQKIIVDSLALSDIEEVKEIRQRLRIDGTWPPADNDRILVCPVSRK